MVTVRKADPALMDKGSQRPREMSPAAREREQQARQFKRLIGQLKGPSRCSKSGWIPLKSRSQSGSVFSA
jgi:hypothetical protein